MSRAQIYFRFITNSLGDCTAGWYCPSGSNSVQMVDCPKGYYCPAVSGEKEACGAGTYLNEINGESAAQCVPCTEGLDIRLCDTL